MASFILYLYRLWNSISINSFKDDWDGINRIAINSFKDDKIVRCENSRSFAPIDGDCFVSLFQKVMEHCHHQVTASELQFYTYMHACSLVSVSGVDLGFETVGVRALN